MDKRRAIAGLAAAVCLATGLNMLVFKKDFFSASVLVVFGVGLVSGLAWVVFTLGAMARQSRQEGKSLYGLNTVASSALFLGICMIAYAFAQHWDRAWDLTQEGRRQLSPQTVQVLETMNKEVAVICFFLKADDPLVRIAEYKTERFLDQCRKHSPWLEVEFLDPQVDRVRLETLNITHHSTQGTVVLQCGTRQRVITVAGASPRLEEREFTNGLINVMRDAQPKVCFLTGHGERDIIDGDERNGATAFKSLLEAEGYLTERIAIRLTAPEVPADCDILVINGLGLKGPQADLNPQDIQAIQEYLDRSGRLLLLLDPWLRASKPEGQVERLRPWLEGRYGIAIGDDVLVSPSTKWSAELSVDPGPFDDDEAMAEFRGCFNGGHRITRNFDQKMLLNVARSVRVADKVPDNVVCTPLLRTPPDFWAEKNVALLFKTGKVYQEPDEPEGPQSVAVAATVKTDVALVDGGPARDARIVVVGDSDLAANGQLTVLPGHLNFLLNAVDWLSENEELIAIRPSGKEDSPIMLSEGEERAIVWISVLGTSQVIAAMGVMAHLLRRKYQ